MLRRKRGKLKEEQVRKREESRVSLVVGGGFSKRQKLQQLTSHGFFIPPEERLTCQHPPSDKGTEGREGGIRGEEEKGGGGALSNSCLH